MIPDRVRNSIKCKVQNIFLDLNLAASVAHFIHNTSSCTLRIKEFCVTNEIVLTYVRYGYVRTDKIAD